MIEETISSKVTDFNSGKGELSHLSQPVPNSKKAYSRTIGETQRAVETMEEDRYTITPKGLAYLEGVKNC